MIKFPGKEEKKTGQLNGKFRDRCDPQPVEWLKVNLIRKSNTLQVRSMHLWDDTVVSPQWLTSQQVFWGVFLLQKRPRCFASALRTGPTFIHTLQN